MSTRIGFSLCGAALLLFVAAPVSFGQYSKHISPGHSGFSGFRGGFSGGYGNTASANPRLGLPNNLSLVAAQTQQGHEGIADLLGQLRRLQDQQVRNEVRFTTLNDSFFERQGVNFGFNLRGADPAGGRGVVGLNPLGQATPNGDLQFRQGGAASAIPPFGGHDPAGDATFGFANRGGEGDLLFNFFGSQGSTRSMVTQAPSVVIPNGGRGTISDTSQVPFVTSVIPVVGTPNLAAITGYGMQLAPTQQSVVAQRLQQLKYERLRAAAQQASSAALQTSSNGPDVRTAKTDADGGDRLLLGGSGGGSGGASSADHGDLSVAEIRRRQEAASATEDAELAAWIERARGAEAAGKANVAKIYYKMAARRAEGEQKQRLIQKVRQLDTP